MRKKRTDLAMRESKREVWCRDRQERKSGIKRKKEKKNAVGEKERKWERNETQGKNR